MGFGIADRLKLIIDSKTDRRGKFAQLESLTPITAENWKSFYYGRQRPNADMIEAIARAWPEYALWLATGLVDASYGHAAPNAQGYPSLSPAKPNSAAYFAALRDCQDEAQRLGDLWFAERFSSEPDAEDRTTIPDSIYRSVHQLGLEDEARKGLEEAQRRLTVAEKLRRAEILLNAEMPAITYDDTEGLARTIEKLLEVRINTKEEGKQKAELQQALKAELDRLERFKALSPKGE